MNTTAISNLLRVLETKEADGSATLTGTNKSKAIEKLIEKLTEATATDESSQAHNYFIRACDMCNADGSKIITDTDQETLITSHVALLNGSWANADSHISAVLDVLQRNDTISPSTVKTINGTNRDTLKNKLIELITSL